HDKPSLFADRIGTAFAGSDRALRIASSGSFRCLAATGNDKCWRRMRGFDRKAEGVKARHGRQIDLRAHIAARYRIHVAVDQSPRPQPLYITFVEGTKALLGKGSRRTQFASAKGSHRSSGGADELLSEVEAVRKRQRPTEAHTSNFIAGRCRDAG